jgi:hypothetical protein
LLVAAASATAQVGSFMPLPKSMIVEGLGSDIAQAGWRRRRIDRWGRRRCQWRWRDRWGRIRCSRLSSSNEERPRVPERIAGVAPRNLCLALISVVDFGVAFRQERWARRLYGAVVTLLAVCGSTHKDSYKDIFMVGILGPIVALIVVIGLGSLVGSF